jgi:L-ascorbate metabolism protein UlaG (beta-lactamase superfamily)
MKTRLISFLNWTAHDEKVSRWARSALSPSFCLISGWLSLVGCLAAQEGPRISAIQHLTNNEVRLQLSAPTGLLYRIEISTGLSAWDPLITLPASTATSLQHTDSAAPYLRERYYRAQQLSGTNILAGDYLVTTNGEVTIRPLNHATFIMSWNGKMIYNDVVAAAGPFTGLPKADLILISHSHSDHFSTSTIDAVRGSNAVIIVPRTVTNSLTAAQRSIAIALGNGDSTNVLGIDIEAVPAYNSNHPLGTGNGYVLTIGGKRIYASGDTGNIPEMRALSNIDVAFVCMNIPYTMTVNDATNAVRAFRPKVVYPYHYRDQSGAVTNASFFKRQMGTDLGIEVRLRKWY